MFNKFLRFKLYSNLNTGQTLNRDDCKQKNSEPAFDVPVITALRITRLLFENLLQFFLKNELIPFFESYMDIPDSSFCVKEIGGRENSVSKDIPDQFIFIRCSIVQEYIRELILTDKRGSPFPVISPVNGNNFESLSLVPLMQIF